MPSPQDSLAVLNSGHTAKSGYGVLIHGAGAPTDGTSGTLGAILYWDETNKVLYQNTNTVASPTWQKVARNGQAFTSALTPTGGIAAAGGFSASARTVGVGGKTTFLTADGIEATMGATTELYTGEIFVPCNMTITGAKVFHGQTTQGDMKAVLMNTSGVVVAISAAVTITSDSADTLSTEMPFLTPYSAVGPANYYLGFVSSTTTSVINTHQFGTFGAAKLTCVYATIGVGTTIASIPTTFTTNTAPLAVCY